MKQIWLLLISICLVGPFVQGQRKTTYVHSYYRKDGTYVSGYTRHYDAGKGSYSYGSIGTGEATIEVVESTLRVSTSPTKQRFRNVSGLKVVPSTLFFDTTGISILVGVLRYRDSIVVDICPLPRSILTYDYDDSNTDLLFRIPKEKMAADDVIELVSKYSFELKDGFLRKFMYLGIGKNELPKFMSLKIESLNLK